MQEVVVHRHVAAPRERLWALATDLAASPRMLSGVEEVEVLTPGQFGVGTRWRETRILMGRSATEEMTVTAVDPPHSYTVEADSGGTHYVSRFGFAPAGDGGTDVTLTFAGHPSAGRSGVAALGLRVLAGLTGPLARRSVSRALRGDLDDLAAAAERPPSPPPL